MGDSGTFSSRKLFWVVAFLSILFFSLSVSSASIDVPDTVLQGERWEISLECPQMNQPNDVCLVEWTGPESGEFEEADGNPDPDAVNQFQVLDVPGTYTYTIKECPAGAPASCGPAVDTDTVIVLVDATPGTLWLRYRSAGPNMRVSGIAPTGAFSVQILVFDENNLNQVVPASSVVPDTGNGNFYEKNINLSGIEPQTLNVRARFRDIDDNVVFTATAVLEALKLDDMQGQLNVLEAEIDGVYARLQAVDANVAALWEESENQGEAIADLNAGLIALEADVGLLQQQVNDLNAEMQAAIADMQGQIDGLQGQIDFLAAVLKVMNHATINIFYNAANNSLDVWGEAPYGVIGNVGLALIPADDPSGGADYTDSVAVGGPNNAYQFTGLNGNAVDTTMLQQDKAYNVLVLAVSAFRPAGAPPIYVVGTIFDVLAIEDLDERLTELENKVEMLDRGSVEFHYNSENNYGTVHGEAPTDANCAKVSFYTASGTFLGSGTSVVTQVPRMELWILIDNFGRTDCTAQNGWCDGADNTTDGTVNYLDYIGLKRLFWARGAITDDYSVTAYMGGWPQEALNVYTEFYESRDCSTGYLSTANDTFSALLSEDLFGFRDITVSSYVTSYYVNTVEVPVTFALKPDDAGNYGVSYLIDKGTGWGFGGNLVGCSWLDEGVKTYKSGDIQLDTLGVNRIKLISRNCFGGSGEIYDSYMFRIRHVDLKDALTAYTTIVSPVGNSDMTYAWPVGSIVDNVYWTQPGMVPLVSYVGTTSEPERLTCKPYYYTTDIQSQGMAEFEIISTAPQTWVCDTGGEFETGDWGSVNYKEGKYTKIRVYNDHVGQPNSFDDVNIGIDDTAPSINSINPDAAGIMNGIYTWYADITDDLSGVKQVDFYLIEKDGYTYCDGNCWTGDGDTVWTVSGVDYNAALGKFYYDLNTLNFPDGDYNVGFGATDIAGNYSYVEVDPMIDNTKPVINSVAVLPAGQKLRGTTIEIQANVTDNLSGVDSVLATITRPDATVDVVALTGTGPVYTGLYPTDASFADGTYAVQVDVVDKAGNDAISALTSFELLYSYVVDIALSTNSLTQGALVAIDGNVLKDDGTVVGAFSVTLVLPNGTVAVDINAVTGQFSYVLDTTSVDAGTYSIRAEATAPNGVVSSDSETLVVSAVEDQPVAPVSPGGNPGAGGGSGAAISLAIDGSCVNKETVVTVTNIKGNPVSGAVVTVVKGFKQVAEATTGEDGTASFALSEPGRYTFRANTVSASSTSYYLELAECREKQPEAPEEGQPEEGPGTVETGSAETGSTGTGSEGGNLAGTTPTGPTGFFGLGLNDASALALVFAVVASLLVFFGWKRFVR